jgi:DNA-binding NarL/FixJ family response regulator
MTTTPHPIGLVTIASVAHGPTAVIVDEWPLVRLGVAQTVQARGIRVVAQVAHGEEAVHTAQAMGAGYLFLGSARDASTPELVRRAVTGDPSLRVLLLLDHPSRDELAAVLSLGVDALLLRTVRPEELSDALDRIGRGERVVAPALLPLLVGLLGPVGDEDASSDGGLTRKELEVLARLAEGMSNREIAAALYVTPATVKSHLAHIYTKLGAAGRQQALARAVALGLLS